MEFAEEEDRVRENWCEESRGFGRGTSGFCMHEHLGLLKDCHLTGLFSVIFFSKANVVVRF